MNKSTCLELKPRAFCPPWSLWPSGKVIPLSFEGGPTCPHSWPLSFLPCLPTRLSLLLTSVSAPQHGFVLASSFGFCNQMGLSGVKPWVFFQVYAFFLGSPFWSLHFMDHPCAFSPKDQPVEEFAPLPCFPQDNHKGPLGCKGFAFNNYRRKTAKNEQWQ